MADTHPTPWVFHQLQRTLSDPRAWPTTKNQNTVSELCVLGHRTKSLYRQVPRNNQ